MQVFPGSHDPRHAGATPPQARSVVFVVVAPALVVVVVIDTHVHGSRSAAPVQVSPGGQDPRHAG